MENQSPKEVKMPDVSNTLKDRSRSHMSSFFALHLPVMFEAIQCLDIEIEVGLPLFCLDCLLTLADMVSVRRHSLGYGPMSRWSEATISQCSDP